MWRAFDETGRLAYPDFVETRRRASCRCTGCARSAARSTSPGMFIVRRTTSSRPGSARPAVYEEPVHRGAAPLARSTSSRSRAPTRAAVPAHRPRFVELAGTASGKRLPAAVHRADDRVAVVVASLFEILPTFLIRSNVPTIATVKPYTPLELAGRDIYIREGCYNCHSQMIRPFVDETERYGEYSKPGEFVYDHPFQWGSARIGPDLAREGGKYPTSGTCGTSRTRARLAADSIMPAYPHLLTDDDRLRRASRRASTRWRCSACRTATPINAGAEAGARAGRRDRGDSIGAGRPEGLEPTSRSSRWSRTCSASAERHQGRAEADGEPRTARHELLRDVVSASGLSSTPRWRS